MRPDFRNSFWDEKVTELLQMTSYRLVYREFFSFVSTATPGRTTLPLPRPEAWVINVTDSVTMGTFGNGTFLYVPFTFSTTILASAESVTKADGLLFSEGGTVTETYVLPVDPDTFFVRTGMACIDEAETPAGAVDAANAKWFYNDYCQADSAGTECRHYTLPQPYSCRDAIMNLAGGQTLDLVFRRAPWDSERADAVRFDKTRWGRNWDSVPNLQPVASYMHDNRVEFRYFPADSCYTRVDGCITGTGWRQLVMFGTSVTNTGDRPLLIGRAGSFTTDKAELEVANNIEPFACQLSFEAQGGYIDLRHRHFGKVSIDGSGKSHRLMGSCIEGTMRRLNTETAPLDSSYTCDYWGIESGWSKEYFSGQPCQWVDTTDEWTPQDAYLRFQVNPDDMICEGNLGINTSDDIPPVESVQFLPDPVDQSRFPPELCTPDTPILAPNCTRPYASISTMDNEAVVTPKIPMRGGSTTMPCPRLKTGETRDCGFTESAVAPDMTCTPGQTVTLSCSTRDNSLAHLIRVCDYSQKLNMSVPCTFAQALNPGGTLIPGDSPVTFSFVCPAAKDDPAETGGIFSAFVAPYSSVGTLNVVSCARLDKGTGPQATVSARPTPCPTLGVGIGNQNATTAGFIMLILGVLLGVATHTVWINKKKEGAKSSAPAGNLMSTEP
jgi:hypothetical protein